ncbi:tRNA (adenosine(37)-N6)-dimethylallyltransferase MiaA [Acanthopleuribacter pedis]
MELSRCVAVVGPTGAGKSEIALTLAEQFGGELVCMDSMQIYKGLTIGTNGPDAAERARVPHHLFGFADIQSPLSSVAYVERARAVLAEIQARGNLPILVGGTGLYLKALVEGLDPMPATPPELRERLNRTVTEKGLPHVYRLLQRLDPAGAARLHANDRQRIQRFLEVRLLSGKSILDLWAQREKTQCEPVPIVIGCAVAREILVEQIQLRAGKMLENGWIEETRLLLQAGLQEFLLQLAPIGYDEIIAHLNGRRTLDDVATKIAIQTRQYAKRQVTWFRKVPYIQWFHFDPYSGYNTARIIAFLNQRLH